MAVQFTSAKTGFNLDTREDALADAAVDAEVEEDAVAGEDAVVEEVARWATSSGEGSSGCQLFVGNLSFETTWQELKDHFRQIGEVSNADVKEHADGRKKGFGTVRFNNPADAERADTQN
jgi:RNA recognition motif-containing protein